MMIRSMSVALTMVAFASSVFADGRTVARVFWQDDAEVAVCYGDLKKSSNGWSLEKQSIDDFPELDQDLQSLVQMRMDGGLIVAGVRDAEDGKLGSGWVAIESGVVEEPHGDHSHWRFAHVPRVSQAVIDTAQGNPAHVYQYGRTFVLANDEKNGFTLTSTKQIRSAKAPSDAMKFFGGGNGHITLAVDPDSVAYATWIAPAGDDQGRVDVVGLGSNLGKSYSIRCPSGTLHGATMNSGKAFFAPANGICWVEVDRELDDDPGSVVVHHVPLGTDGDDRPLRTGAFSNMGHHVVFTAGKGDASKICWVDASSPNPGIKSLSVKVKEGEAITTPLTIRSRYGDKLAIMFGQNRETPSEDRMIVVNLDPDQDGKFDDAEFKESIGVGPNQIVGHSGYHAAVMLPDGRHALITNPGDGSLWVISLLDFSVRAKLHLGGVPTRLLAIGG